MDPRPVPVHNLRGNAKVWTPATVAVVDTETRTEQHGDALVEVLRLWCAQLVERRTTRKSGPVVLDGLGETAGDLAGTVDAWSRGHDTLWIYCHNTSFDLTTTQIPIKLTEIGWSITDFAVHTGSPWFRLSKGRKRLVITDSWSVLPRPLEDLGRMVGTIKPPLPGQDDTMDTWYARCRADVDITMRAVLACMDWWDANELGQWSITGPSTGWHAYRHVPSAGPMVIVPDQAGIDHDRAATYGGRRGVWQVGRFAGGPFYELDFTAAYPTIAAHLPLPTKREWVFDTLPLDDQKIDSQLWSLVAEVEVDTDIPRWPVRLHDRTFHPVGRFRTVLCGPEITEARDLGCLKAILGGYTHRIGPQMQPWARWLLSVQHSNGSDHPEVARVMAKLWGRSVIGRFAARGSETVELGPAPNAGWHIEECWDAEHRVRGALVDMAGTRYWTAMTGETDDTYPAVYAWVESHVRVRIGRVIEALGPGAVLQCNTDGLLVDGQAVGRRSAGGALQAPSALSPAARLEWCLAELAPLTAPLSLRVKTSYRTVEVKGPQHVRLGSKRRFAGIPGLAMEPERDKFTFRAWPKLQWQLEHGEAHGYVRPELHATVSGVYAPGWVLDDGTVWPIECEIGPDGSTRIVPWARQAIMRPRPVMLADEQNPVLAPYW